MPRLRIINVADCGVGTSGMAALASALAKADTPSLESIVLDGNTVMDSKNAAMDALRDVLTSQPTLATLSLARTNLGHRGCVALAAHLRLNSSLRKLSLDLAGLGDSAGAADDDESAAAALGSAIAAHGQLTHLQLSRNNLGDTGVCAFANAMLSGVAGKTIALKHLGLAMNNISADGARALGSLLRAIAVNSSAAAAGSLDGLATLDLSDNRVDDAGFAHLVDAVAIEGGTLVNLVLQGNMIGDSGITQLIEQAIVPDETLSAVDAKRPLSLKYVNLAGNPQITAAGYDALTTALEKNTTIKGVARATRSNQTWTGEGEGTAGEKGVYAK
ncbi:RNI-like protein [Ramicandelaber brevisporus]|nr:RNI-like protein [Ramicandelaber brevisporus]